MPREFKTILCPSDFSERSRHALDYALRFAKNSDGELIITHIIHVPAGELMGAHELTGVGTIAGSLSFDEARRHALSQLEELHASHLERYAKCQLLVDVGDPAQQIVSIAKERNVDLIVTTTHGRTGLSHLIMGSVAEKIIRHAPCPVFVIRAGVE
jgi:universal stress protein A